eukprot:TRINITY_DN40389_c0_g1_i1.p1 TRINITY_DN40389_c0_g1~~TRINITY_DN40389_c0_g1_i1.p1  ORF type:complete len:383 (+),score=67.25 TRINITY_DN40389_c0_g1_i1:10-1158(+)
MSALWCARGHTAWVLLFLLLLFVGGAQSCDSNRDWDRDPHCIPACDGKACGPDGCGATCGECDSSHGFFCNTDSVCEHRRGSSVDTVWEIGVPNFDSAVLSNLTISFLSNMTINGHDINWVKILMIPTESVDTRPPSGQFVLIGPVFELLGEDEAGLDVTGSLSQPVGVKADLDLTLVVSGAEVLLMQYDSTEHTWREATQTCTPPAASFFSEETGHLETVVCSSSIFGIWRKRESTGDSGGGGSSGVTIALGVSIGGGVVLLVGILVGSWLRQRPRPSRGQSSEHLDTSAQVETTDEQDNPSIRSATTLPMVEFEVEDDHPTPSRRPSGAPAVAEMTLEQIAAVLGVDVRHLTREQIALAQSGGLWWREGADLLPVVISPR